MADNIKSELTLRDYAEFWWMNKGNLIPPRNTAAYEKMYFMWHNWSFEYFSE